MGREQNGIFESLAEYTHKVQAEVRALQLARDRFSAEEEIPPVASRGMYVYIYIYIPYVCNSLTTDDANVDSRLMPFIFFELHVVWRHTGGA